MGAVVLEEATEAKSDIGVWFKWAERLTTGLGLRRAFDAQEKNNFDAVLLSAVEALFEQSKVPLQDMLRFEIARVDADRPRLLITDEQSQFAVERITLFMLDQLAKVDDVRAFDIAEDFRAMSGKGVFASRLALFQMTLADGNENLTARDFDYQSWGKREDHVAIAGAQRNIDPDMNANVERVMRGYFKPLAPSLSAA
jgi:hypothetical protein